MAGMIRYPEEYNPILEYWEKIQNKEIIVSNKVYRTYKKVVYDIQNPGEYYYSPKRANHVIEFAENYCRHSKGKFGKEFCLNCGKKLISQQCLDLLILRAIGNTGNRS